MSLTNKIFNFLLCILILLAFASCKSKSEDKTLKYQEEYEKKHAAGPKLDKDIKPKKKTNFTVGEAVEAKNFTYVVKEAKKQVQDPNGNSKEGKKYSIVTIEIKNHTDTSHNITPDTFELKDSWGNTYKLSESFSTDILNVDIEPGATKKGILVFEIGGVASGLNLGINTREKIGIVSTDVHDRWVYVNVDVYDNQPV